MPANPYPINRSGNYLFGGGNPFGGGTGGGGANLTGAPATGYDPRFGGIPQVPDPRFSTGSAITANMGNLSELFKLFGNLNTFNAGQANDQLLKNMPGYAGLTQQRSDVTGQELHGQVPQDVVDLLIQQAAERSIGTGSPGSPNANSAYLRALGLTSLGQVSKGMSDLSTGIHDTPTAPLANPASMFITPDAIQQAQMAANLYRSAPVPAAAAAEAIRQGTVSTPKYGGASSGRGYGAPGNEMAGAGGIFGNNSYYGAGGFPGDVWAVGGGALSATQPGYVPDYSNGWYGGGGGAPQDPSSIYDPILDVSANPNTPGGYYDWSNVDLGFP